MRREAVRREELLKRPTEPVPFIHQDAVQEGIERDLVLERGFADEFGVEPPGTISISRKGSPIKDK